jgi:hypothetical protein
MHTRLLCSLLLSFLIFACSSQQSPIIKKQPVAQVEVKLPLTSGQETIWIEGEDASTHDFLDHSWFNNPNRDLLSPGIPGVTDGDWLVHYRMGDNAPSAQAAYPFEVSEGGQYEVWLRVIVPFTKGWISIDSGNQIELDIDSNVREQISLIWPSPYEYNANWCKVGDWCVMHHSIGWVKAGTFEFSPGQHSLIYGVESHPHWTNGGIVGGLDAIAIFNHHWGPSGAGQPADNEAQAGASDWFAFHPKDTPTDWSESVFHAGIETPAGAHGAAQQSGADVVFEDGTSVKFWGVGAFPPGNEDRMTQQASLLAAMGVNLVRVHPLQSSIGNPIDPDRLDHFDRWFSILKDHGIYAQWSIFYPHKITADDGYPLYDELNDGSTSGLVTVFPELQAYEWAYLQQVMEHKNPYTGMTYADDPALAIVEVRNEDSIFFHNPLSGISDAYPKHTAILQEDWASWLAEKYGDDETLFAAWGDGVRGGDSLSNVSMKIYHSWEMNGDGPLDWKEELVPAEEARMGDWIQFLAERQCDGYLNRRDKLRQANYKGVVLSTGWKVGGEASDMANLWTDACLEMIDRHTYQGGGSYKGGGTLITGDVGQNNAHQGPGHGILGWNHMQVENKPMQHSEWIASAPTPWKADSVPTYAFYGMGLYGWDAGLNFTASSGFSYQGGWPHLTMWEIMTPHHLGQYPAVSRAVHEGHLTEGAPAHAERFTKADAFTGKDERVEYDSWLGAVGPIVKSFEGGSTETVNIEDYRDGKFVKSNTGELAWHTDGWYKIMAQKSQGIVGKVGPAAISLPDVEVELTTPFVSLLFTSLDGNPLSTSGSILITAMARDKQTGAIYNADQTKLVALGGPPLLMEPVEAKLTFGGDPIMGVNILDEHGIPVGSVDDVDGNTVVIDGRWKTAWYQVLRDVPDPPPEVEPTPPTPDQDPASDTATGAEVADAADAGPAPKKPRSSGGSCAAAPSGSSTHIVWFIGLMALLWYRQRHNRVSLK